MLFDSINLIEGAVATNFTVASGPSLPSLPSIGEIFFLMDTNPSLYVYTGTTWIQVGSGATSGGSSSTSNEPYEIAFTVPGQMPDGEVILHVPLLRSLKLPANAEGSRASSLSPASSTVEFKLQKNGVQFGTMRFAQNAVATFVCTETTFAAGDFFTMLAPSPVDSTLSDVGGIFSFTKI